MKIMFMTCIVMMNKLFFLKVCRKYFCDAHTNA